MSKLNDYTALFLMNEKSSATSDAFSAWTVWLSADQAGLLLVNSVSGTTLLILGASRGILRRINHDDPVSEICPHPFYLLRRADM
ncbi:MAG: hypothetical protein PHY16_00640 [Methylobacter sp.]|nr:hypothetical protein [Methylobacter sp.]